jgi:hypothetical protein
MKTRYHRVFPVGELLLQGPVFVNSLGQATIYVWCPYCRKQQHIHGWDADAPHWAVSHRAAHCFDGSPFDGYYIRQAPRLRVPPGYLLREGPEMNPQPTEFDLAEELTHFHDPGHELYGLPERIFFYLVQTCRAIEAFSTPSFGVEAVLDPKSQSSAGCVVEFVVHRHEFRIDTYERLKLWASDADEAGSGSSRWLVFEGDAANPTAWEGLLKAIGRVEHLYVVGAQADRLRHMWTQWLAEQERLRKERGW